VTAFTISSSHPVRQSSIVAFLRSPWVTYFNLEPKHHAPRRRARGHRKRGHVPDLDMNENVRSRAQGAGIGCTGIWTSPSTTISCACERVAAQVKWPRPSRHPQPRAHRERPQVQQAGTKIRRIGHRWSRLHPRPCTSLDADSALRRCCPGLTRAALCSRRRNVAGVV
jgi:hypothetical protein